MFQLYSEFAEPLALLEIMLLIYHVSDHQDPYHVMRTWEALVDEATQDVPVDSDAIQVLSTKVSTLSRRFYPSDVVLPLRK